MKKLLKSTLTITLLVGSLCVYSSDSQEYDFWGPDSSSITIPALLSGSFSTATGSPISGVLSSSIGACISQGLGDRNQEFKQFVGELVECMIVAPTTLVPQTARVGGEVLSSSVEGISGGLSEGTTNGLKEVFGYDSSTKMVREEAMEQLSGIATGNQVEGELGAYLVDEYIKQVDGNLTRSEAAIKVMATI